MQRHKKYEDTKIRETLYTGTKNTRTQKLRKNYAETPKIQGLRNQGNIMQRHHKYEDTEIREPLCRDTKNTRTQKLGKHYKNTPKIRGLKY